MLRLSSPKPTRQRNVGYLYVAARWPPKHACSSLSLTPSKLDPNNPTGGISLSWRVQKAQAGLQSLLRIWDVDVAVHVLRQAEQFNIYFEFLGRRRPSQLQAEQMESFRPKRGYSKWTNDSPDFAGARPRCHSRSYGRNSESDTYFVTDASEQNPSFSANCNDLLALLASKYLVSQRSRKRRELFSCDVCAGKGFPLEDAIGECCFPLN